MATKYTFVSSLPDRYRIRNWMPKSLIINTDSSVTCDAKDQANNIVTNEADTTVIIDGAYHIIECNNCEGQECCLQKTRDL